MNNSDRKVELLKNAISPYAKYCDGYGNLGSSGDAYILGLTLGIGVVKKEFSHPGSTMLDQINAFDTAEIYGPYLGQINMSVVSSFCGLRGLIWGYDIAKSEIVNKKSNLLMYSTHKGKRKPVYSINPLIDATEKLFGNVEKRNFPLIPGAHVPCATKNIKVEGPARVYAAIAIGIAEDRNKDACLLMEDVGLIREQKEEEINIYHNLITNRISRSVIQIGMNQKVEYKKILVGVRSIFANEGEFACSLVAAPYFTIAKDAIPHGSIEKLTKMNLNEWQAITKNRGL
ncbi:MAG: histidine decarboxylase, pyruvoyl type [Candidatus Dojkabacteria bacterium]